MGAIARIDCYAAQGRQAFEQNELIQAWFTQNLTQNLQVIGEASRSLSSTLQAHQPEVPWADSIIRASFFSTCNAPCHS